MTATGALVEIQEMAAHSQKGHDGGSFRGLGGSNSYGMSVITNKLNELGNVMRKLKESVHAIQATGYREERSNVEVTKYLMGPSGSHSPLDKGLV
ncbi:hypothetical protein Tco_0107678 [Tanacetum coccineum]